MARRKKMASASARPSTARRGARPGADMSLDIVRTRGVYGALGYTSAATAIREGRAPSSGSGDYHQQFDREQLVLQARDFSRNNGIFKGMVERATCYVIGTGFGIQAKTSDPEWNAKAEALWKEWWKFPEVRGVLAGNAVEDMVCRESMTVGELGVIKTDRKLLQLIESEQIKYKGKALDGIEKDEVGRPTGYWVSSYSETGQAQIGKARKYAPEEFLFVTRPDRPSATRSVPPLQSVFAMLHRINDVCDSEAIAWQLLARMAISITRENGPAIGFNESVADPDLEGADLSGKASTRILELDWATIFHGKPGEKIEGIERNIPGQNFSASLTTFLRLLGLPLGLPLEIILLDWTKSNYSQSRAVLLQAFVSFIKWQLSFEASFHGPVYRWFVDMRVAEGALAEVPDRYLHEWIKPTFPWIDQLAEAQAYGLKLDRSFCTHAEVLKSLNRDRDEVLAQRDREIRSAIEISARIEKDTGVKVPWQQFAGLLTATPGAPAAPQEVKEEKAKPEEDKNE